MSILNVYNLPDFNTKIKKDNSPLTKADLAYNSAINSFLEKTNYLIINKENN